MDSVKRVLYLSTLLKLCESNKNYIFKMSKDR